MNFDHAKFLTLCGNFSDSQREGMDFLLTFLENDPAMTYLGWIAYSIATVQRECANTYQPISEYGKGEGHPYGIPDPETGQTYYGRGFVQLTWKANYETMGKVLGVDLVNNPNLALDPPTAYRIMSYGMRNGSFTGVGLSRFINSSERDYFNARKIINGLDCAQEIADAATWFDQTLTACLI